MNHSTSANGQIGLGEFVALMAFTMSLVALSIDAMLPAFTQMAADLEVARSNDIQLIISTLFVGLAIGQLFYGPLSDSIGRKPAIYAGGLLFVLGSLLSMLATDFNTMLIGRLLQGFGAAGPRTVAMALIRDRFHGSEMARVMSFIMTVFILVPILAPALGQAILLFAGWRTIFGSFVVLAVMTMAWLAVRQAETLLPEQRKAFTLRNISGGFGEVLKSRVAIVYTLVASCVSGAFFGYLNSCQQIFQVQYGLGKQFPVYFAVLALAVGVASLLNSAMVMRFGMHKLANRSLQAMMVLSWIFLLIAWPSGGHPPLWLMMLICLALFFCIGILFGNLNSIAMEPLGHVAGTAAAAIGTFTTLVAIALGFIIGQVYDGSLLPMAFGFVSLTTVAVFLTRLARVQTTHQG